MKLQYSCSTTWMLLRLGEYAWRIGGIVHSLLKGHIFPHAFPYGV